MNHALQLLRTTCNGMVLPFPGPVSQLRKKDEYLVTDGNVIRHILAKRVVIKRPEIEFDGIRNFGGHQYRVLGLAVAADNRRFASCGQSGVVRVWSLRNGNHITAFQASDSAVLHIEWLPESGYVITSDRAGRIQIRDRAKAEKLPEWVSFRNCAGTAFRTRRLVRGFDVSRGQSSVRPADGQRSAGSGSSGRGRLPGLFMRV